MFFNLESQEQKDQRVIGYMPPQRFIERLKKTSELKGEAMDVNFGSQIRSYVFHPYSLVKDHRTNYETGNVDAVMNGEINEFIEAYLKKYS